MNNSELIELNEAIKILLEKKELIEFYMSKGARYNGIDARLPQAIIRVLDELGRYENIEYDTKVAYEKGYQDGFKQAKFDIEMDKWNEGEV